MGNFILVLPGIIKDSLVRPAQKITEDISALFLLLSNATHTGVEHDEIKNYKDKDDNYDTTMANTNESK